MLANRFASYLRTGLYVIAFHVGDLWGLRLVGLTRGITKPPRVWHYEGGDFHIVDLDGQGLTGAICWP